ncbi:MAG: spore maturation protein [Terrimonas ferruginea]|jgi:spore maturation protein SpmA/spore maturation protein SpmB|uniref:nucleoside recognition domain-containing protein n=1 Tax=Terrimonas ferruginea TaxID=249 RepID=UPI00092A2090|nr:spore maturation protein [Terrimonas ferruginea]MBN8783087.1 spore maturation protein [Terrimonas ferruginea]OJW44263.1 MAG: spore maturation protein [Sphingobacteriales bacterium 48-107]
MALSRIWSAFIIVALSVALFRFAFNGSQDDIFGRMVTGSSKDEFRFYAIGDPAKYGYPSLDSFARKVAPYSFKRQDAPDESTKFLLTDNLASDSVKILTDKFKALRAVEYSYVTGRLQKPVDGVIETCKSAVNICLGLIGIMALFMGFMSIAERAGGVRFLSRIVGPFFSKLFPEVPKNHPAIGHMMMNFSANMLNLDNAATPFGIKAMESLQELNPDKERASNAQVMFLCLHASGLTLIPITIIAARASVRAANPTDIFLPCMIATFMATIAAMIIVAFKQKIRLFQPVVILWVGGLSALIAGLVLLLVSMNTVGVNLFSDQLSNGLILSIFLLITLGGLYKRINIFDAFVEGAKGGFETAIRIIPYLVGILVAISLLRSSGTFDVVIAGMKQLFGAFGADTRFVDGLPTALIKPMSGSGARGMMFDTMNTFGPDSFAGRLSCILQGSSDTTFYVIAVYFGAVGIKNTRYSIGAMLLADLVGIITAISLCYLFFG